MNENDATEARVPALFRGGKQAKDRPMVRNQRLG